MKPFKILGYVEMSVNNENRVVKLNLGNCNEMSARLVTCVSIVSL